MTDTATSSAYLSSSYPWNFVAEQANLYYPQVIKTLMEFGDEASPRGLRTKELHPTTVQIYNPRNRVITSHGRVLNMPFALAEVIQILCGQNDAQALRHYNSQIIKIQGDVLDWQLKNTEYKWEDRVTRFNAAYGERMRAFDVSIRDGGFQLVDQLNHMIMTLTNDRDSRQASIVLSHPYYDNFSQNTKDRACNVYCHAMIRDGALDWMQIVRSNDAVWGVPYNMMQWTSVQEYVATSLGVPMGKHFLVQDSLHVYENFWEECASIEPFNLYDYMEYIPLEMKVGHQVLKVVALWETYIRGNNFPNRDGWKEIENQVGVYWTAVLSAFASYAQFKIGNDKEAYDMLPEYSEIRLPMLRCYMHWRWGKNYAKYPDQTDATFLDLTAVGMPFDEVRKWTGQTLL